MPLAVSTACTRSWSPTEAPPSVTRMSAPAAARAARCAPRSPPGGRGTMPRSSASRAGSPAQRGDAIGVGRDDLVGAGRRCRAAPARRRWRGWRPAAAATTGSVGVIGRRPPATAPRGSSTRPASSSTSPVAKSSPARRMWRPGGDRLDRLRCRRRRASRILLDDDGVGAVGHRRAGEDAHGLAGADRAVEARGRRRLADHRQPSPARLRRRPRAPHSRPWPRRRRAAACAARMTGSASTRPAASASGDALGRRAARRRRAGAASASSTGKQRHQSPSAVRRAVVARTCRRSSRRSRMPAIAMPRSTALAMS